MADIFVNLKRFEVPRQLGGLSPSADPLAWITEVIRASLDLGLGEIPGTRVVYLLPEGLVAAARQVLDAAPAAHSRGLSVGCQGVHWKDIETGVNFGAFTTSLPARAAAALGCTWSIIGHSEERRAKLQVIEAYAPEIGSDPDLLGRAQAAVNRLVRDEVRCALSAGLNVLLCVGETAAERGEGSFSDQKPRIQAVLQQQLHACLPVDPGLPAGQPVIIGYEPVWAIGPGKIPPDAGYIAFVSETIQQVVLELTGSRPVVVYGGGLKAENAASIGGIATIGGGLVALTRFTGEIGFDPQDLRQIIDRFLDAERSRA